MTTQAIQDVIAERQRQKEVEGWTEAHDDEHRNNELAWAAASYAIFDEGPMPLFWPWHRSWWKPTTYRRNLVKAAALILAEIERIDRSAHPKEGT